jgi:hypothetical protein
MRAAGIPALILGVGGLRGSAEVSAAAETVQVFSQHVPDQAGWLLRLSRHYRETTLLGLANRMNYHEPIELLSMYTCLYMKDASPHPQYALPSIIPPAISN